MGDMHHGPSTQDRGAGRADHPGRQSIRCDLPPRRRRAPRHRPRRRVARLRPLGVRRRAGSLAPRPPRNAGAQRDDGGARVVGAVTRDAWHRHVEWETGVAYEAGWRAGWSAGRADALLRVAELDATWRAPARVAHEERVATRMREMERAAAASYERLGYPPGHAYHGGPVDWDGDLR